MQKKTVLSLPAAALSLTRWLSACARMEKRSSFLRPTIRMCIVDCTSTHTYIHALLPRLLILSLTPFLSVAVLQRVPSDVCCPLPCRVVWRVVMKCRGVSWSGVVCVGPRNSHLLADTTFSVPHCHRGFDNDLRARSNVKIVLCETAAPDFRVTAAALRKSFDAAAAKGIKVRAILLTNPNNPLGTCMVQEELEAVRSFILSFVRCLVHSVLLSFVRVCSFGRSTAMLRSVLVHGASTSIAGSCVLTCCPHQLTCNNPVACRCGASNNDALECRQLTLQTKLASM